MPKKTVSKRSKKVVSAFPRKEFMLAGLVILFLVLPVIALAIQKFQDNNKNVHASGTWPTTPPALVCGNTSLLTGPATAPAGSVTVPAGDNSSFNFATPNTTYWFAPGTHTLGTGEYSQIAPANGATYIGAPGAVLDGKNLNRYAFTQHATGVTIKYLTIQGFNAPQDEGVVNHNSGDNWTFQYNTIQNNHGGALFLGTNNIASYNCLKDNGQYGFQGYSDTGPTNITLDHNEISGNNTDDLETKNPGCGCTGGGKFWDAHNVTITNNYVHDNKSVGIWADTNDTDFLVENNYISGNYGVGLFYEISYNMTVRNNNFVRNAIVEGPKNPGFPTGAIYLSESGGDSRVPGRTANIDISSNNFDNNWSGVILWENADRFCNSPANTSSGTCTLVNPKVTISTCSSGTITTEPNYSDCRWKTQNVKVHDNTFNLDRSAIANCTVGNSCGLQGIFSNYGTYPSWSPYQGDKIANAITFNQNNLFSNNYYVGDWRFMGHDQGNVMNFATWQAAPYKQDAGSSFNGAVPTSGINPTATTIPTNTVPTTIVASPTSKPLATPTAVPTVSGNALNGNTSGMETGLGYQNWYSSSVSQSKERAHSGTYSMKVAVTAPYGWGVQLTNWPGFAATPGQKKISFWASSGTSYKAGVIMKVEWFNASRKRLKADEIKINNLNNAWSSASSVVTAPAGTTTVNVTFTNTANTGTPGSIVYIDDVFVSK